MAKYKCILITVLLTTLLTAGCIQPGAGIQTANDAGINIALDISSDQLAVGDAQLMVTLTDDDGTPINDATLNVQGDMTHAGMVPVLREIDGNTAGITDGVYHIPFEWTMAGDWIVTILVTLNDGTEVEETFDMSVAVQGESGNMGEMEHGEGEMAHGEGEMEHGEGEMEHGEGEMEHSEGDGQTHEGNTSENQ